jgi:hypothetical protein
MSVPACGGGRAREGASSEAETNPRARLSPLEGGVNPRAGRSPLEGAFDWAALVGRGGHRGVSRASCVCLSERCFVFVFLRVLSRIPLVVLGDSQGCPRQVGTSGEQGLEGWIFCCIGGISCSC